MRSPHPSTARKSGFTLIELLVVVAIIALLISILLPSLARAREIAKRTACASNLGHMGRSVLTYSESNKGSLPVAYSSPTVGAPLSSGCLVGNSRDKSDTDLFLSGGRASTPRSYFKMLIGGRRALMQPKQFICPSGQASLEHRSKGPDISYIGSTAVSELPFFDFAGSRTSQGDSEMTDFSYSFQASAKHYETGTTGTIRGIPLTNTQDPRKAVAADRNPYSNTITGKSSPNPQEPAFGSGFGTYTFVVDKSTGGMPAPPKGTGLPYMNALRRPTASGGVSYNPNSRNHRQEGQNVLRLDGSCKWWNNAKVGADDDSIWGTLDDGGGSGAVTADLQPAAATAYGMTLSRSSWLTDSILIP